MERETKVGTRCGVSAPQTYLVAPVCTASSLHNLLGHALRRVIDVSVITATPLKLAEDIRNLDPLPNF